MAILFTKTVLPVRNKMKGYTLVELSVAIVIIGFVVTILANFYSTTSESAAKQQSVLKTEGIEQAILGFIFANGRLPCPSANMSGVEDCSLDKGELPVRALGMADPVRNQAGITLRYAVFDRALTGVSDISLTQLNHRHQVFMATDDNAVGTRPVAANRTLNQGSPNGLDLCQALLSGSKMAVNNSGNLHTGSGANLKNVAYLIHDLGLQNANNSGGLFDGINTATSTDLGFSSPTDLVNLNNDDLIYVKHFEQLWSDLQCVSVVSAAGSAHANVATASAIMNQAMADYLVQAKLAADVATADIASSVATILSATAGIAAAAATIPIAVSDSLLTKGAAAPIAVLAAAGVVAAATAGVTAGLTTALAAMAKVGADALVNDIIAQVGEMNTLNSSVYGHVLDADAAGLYN